MSFYTDASLVLIPSGYKTSKVYSAKPVDGSGDLTFTRSNDTATRVGSDGLIEKVRTNLVLQSNSFNTTWALTTASVTSGQAGYDGTNNAWLLTKTAGNGRVEQSISASGSLTFSVYAKANANDWILLRADTTGGVRTSYFNISSGAIGVSASCTPAIESAGNGYYRCSISFNDSVTIFRIYVGDSDGSSLGTSGNILIQAAQLEAGDIATEPILTTSAAVSVGPVANLPRLDYLGSSCGKLLLEPQRTNALTFSEQMDNGAWTKDGATISANSTTSPDGFVNADKVVENTANSEHVIFRSIFGTGATFSFFAKAAGRNFVAVLSNNSQYSFFNIGDGTLGTIAATSTATITAYGNGWYRCTLYNTHQTYGAVVNLASANGTTVYTGDGTSGAFIWGCQLEASAAYETSYIPTLGAAVTRTADACSKTGISSLIGQTEGTLFVEAPIEDVTSNHTLIRAGVTASFSNSIIVEIVGARVYGIIYASSVAQCSIFSEVQTAGSNVKVALAYKENDFALYINGVQIGTDNSGSVPSSVGSLWLGNIAGAEQNTVNQALLFKTRLTNAQLAELTTL